MDYSYNKTQKTTAKDGISGDRAVTYHYTTGHPNNTTIVVPNQQLSSSLKTRKSRFMGRVIDSLKNTVVSTIQRVVPKRLRANRDQRQNYFSSKVNGIQCNFVDRKGKIRPSLVWPLNDIHNEDDCYMEEMLDSVPKESREKDQSMQPKQEELAAPYACGRQSVIVTTCVVTDVFWHKFIVSSEDMFKQMVFSAKRQIQMTFVETMSDTKSTNLELLSLEIHNQWSFEERVESNTDEREKTFEERLGSLCQTLQIGGKEDKIYDYSHLSGCLQKKPQIKQEIDSNKAISFEKMDKNFVPDFGNLSVCVPNKSRQIDKAFKPKIEFKTKPIVSKIETKEKCQSVLSLLGLRTQIPKEPI